VRLFTYNPAAAGRNLGRVMFALFLAALGFMFWRRRDGVTWQRLLPWAAAGCFATCAALLLAIGRSNNVSDRSMMPRYIPMTLFLDIALVAFAAYAVQWWAAEATTRRTAARRAAWGWGIAAAFAVLLINAWGYGLFKMAAWRDSRLEGRAALTYIKLFEPEKVGRLDNTLDFLREQATLMDAHGLLHPPLAKRWEFAPFSRSALELGPDEAELRDARLAGRRIEVSGFALVPSGRIADGVLISVRGDGEDWQVVGFAESRAVHVLNIIYIDDHFGQGADLTSREMRAGFSGSAELAAPRSRLQVLCWALDMKTLQAFPIGDPQPLSD
jgi:hypothetical protein